jgi:hypothetical protein
MSVSWQNAHSGEGGDLLPVDIDAALAGLNLPLELAVGGVVFEHVGQVVVADERVVNGHQLDVLPLQGSASHQATNATKACNSSAAISAQMQTKPSV